MVIYLGLLALGFVNGFLLTQIIRRLLTVKKGWQYFMILYVICWLQANMIIYFRDWVNLIPTAAVFLAGICLACDGSVLKKATMGLMTGGTVFAFSILNDNFLWIGGYRSPAVKFFFFLTLYLLIRRFPLPRDYELSASMWRLMLLLTLTPVGGVLTVALLSGYRGGADAGERLQALILILIFLFSIVGLLWAALVLARQQKLEQERTLALINQKYYEAVEQQNLELRRLKHDMANHLQALAALPASEKKEYIQELLEKPVFSATLRYCGDSVVNAVLGAKTAVMNQREIDFHGKVEILSELPFDKNEVCALLGNALDNAIEACDKLPQGRREIFLEARFQKGLFVLDVKNPVLEAPKREEGRIKTSKPDKDTHGFGLSSIGEIVKKNGGELQIEIEDAVFHLFLYMPE